MPGFRRIIAELKKQERRLAAQLASVRTAISSLEFGSAGVPRQAIIETPATAEVVGGGEGKDFCGAEKALGEGQGGEEVATRQG